jgi:hypothetical protein
MNDRLCGLERMGVLLSLAGAIYYAHCLLDRAIDRPHFEALPAPVRHFYLELAMADSTRRPVAPDALFDHVASVARAEAARVIGTISPVAPWGEAGQKCTKPGG